MSLYSDDSFDEQELLDLHKACRLGNTSAIKKAVLAQPDKINDKDQGVKSKQLGWTPLYRTVICGHYKAAEFLLANHADPNEVNNLGESALHQAADNSQYALAELLLKHGANPNSQQNDGDTPLHHAAFRGDLKMVEVLLKSEASPNTQNFRVSPKQFGRTPLHYASDCGYADCVRQMVRSGADLAIVDRVKPKQQGKSAPDLATCEEVVLAFNETDISENFSPILEPDFISPRDLDEQFIKIVAHTQPLETFGRATLKPIIIHEVSTLDNVDSAVRRRVDDLTPLYDWLEKLNLQELYEVLVSGGYDDISSMIDQMHSPLPITEQMLQHIGITKPGHRVKLLMKLDEEAGPAPSRPSRARFEAHSSRNFLKCCIALSNATAAFICPPSLAEWLRVLRLECLHSAFVKAGYEDLETLVSQLSWRKPLNDEVLMRDIGIQKPGYRNRILSKLQEEQQTVAHKPDIVMETTSNSTACEMCRLM
jgi:hypothetical protein